MLILKISVDVRILLGIKQTYKHFDYQAFLN